MYFSYFNNDPGWGVTYLQNMKCVGQAQAKSPYGEEVIVGSPAVRMKYLR